MKTKLLAIFAALMLATACGPATKPDTGQTLRVGNQAEPQSLDPAKVMGSWDGRIATAMFQGMLARNAKGEPVPGMAESWTTSEDGLTWTFKLRDATWSDSVPVTAQDFVAGFERLFTILPPPDGIDMLYPILGAKELREGNGSKDGLGVRALDTKTLEIKLTNPTPFFPHLLAYYRSAPVPRHAIAKFGEDWIKAENIVTNGAFTLKEWKPGDFVHLVRNRRYWNNASVCLDDLYLFPTADSVAAERQMRTGDLDLQLGFSGSRLAEINKTMPGTARVAPTLRTDYMSFNNRKPPFTDGRLRRALSLAIDREFIANQVLNDGSTPAYSMVPPTTPNYPATAALRWKNEPRARRLDEARALLVAAGYGPSKPFVFRMLHSSGGDVQKFVPVIQQNWREIAPWVQPTLEGAELAVHYRNLQAGNFDVGVAAWGGTYADATDHLGLTETGNTANDGRFLNPTFDALLDRARQTVDTKARADILTQAEQIMLDDTGVAPLFFPAGRNLVNPKVTGWEDNPLNLHPFELLCKKR